MARSINRDRMFLLTKSIEVQVLRAATVGGYNDEGLWEAGTRLPVTIKANIQPLKAAQTLLLTPSERTKEWINIWTKDVIYKMEEGQYVKERDNPDNLNVMATGHPWEADLVVYDRKTYKVMGISKYRMGVLDHYHALAALDSPTTEGQELS
jgi:hypothetical protein